MFASLLPLNPATPPLIVSNVELVDALAASISNFVLGDAVPMPNEPVIKVDEPKVIKLPLSLILLLPIAEELVNFGKVFVVPVPVIGLDKVDTLPSAIKY